MIGLVVPRRVRSVFLDSMDNPDHGRGPAGESLAAKLRGAGPRTRIELTPAEREVLIEEADTLFTVSADDAGWDPDAKNDREAARRCLRKLGIEPW